jgi:hypothetical protein
VQAELRHRGKRTAERFAPKKAEHAKVKAKGKGKHKAEAAHAA